MQDQKGRVPVREGEVTRTEVRPGLVMVKTRTLKEDGRYLIYFDFERGEPASGPAAE